MAQAVGEARQSPTIFLIPEMKLEYQECQQRYSLEYRIQNGRGSREKES